MADDQNDEEYTEAMEVMLVSSQPALLLKQFTNVPQQDLGIKRREVLSTQDDRTRLASDYQKRLFNAQNRVGQSETDPETAKQKNEWKCKQIDQN